MLIEALRLNLLASSFGGHQSFTVRILGDFLLALPSNNQFIIKLVKMWPGGAPRGGWNFEVKP